MSIFTAAPTELVSYLTFSLRPLPPTTTLGPFPQLPVQLQRVTLNVSGVSSVSQRIVALEPWFMHDLSVQTLMTPPVESLLSCSSSDSADHATLLSLGGRSMRSVTSPSAATIESMTASKPAVLTILSLMASTMSPTSMLPLCWALAPSLRDATYTVLSSPSSRTMPRGLGRLVMTWLPIVFWQKALISATCCGLNSWPISG
mmetsp:Transcript_57660/g.141404  ORF Transcript_57660/g.141404 Transcript_57660/m.141404 type:complete len:202 (-) Transcript_57660:830-1435(-)